MHSSKCWWQRKQHGCIFPAKTRPSKLKLLWYKTIIIKFVWTELLSPVESIKLRTFWFDKWLKEQAVRAKFGGHTTRARLFECTVNVARESVHLPLSYRGVWKALKNLQLLLAVTISNFCASFMLCKLPISLTQERHSFSHEPKNFFLQQ